MQPATTATFTPVTRTRTITETGLELPMPADFRARRPDAPETVFVTLDTLMEIAEQDTWDSQFGKVLLLGYFEGKALAAAGLAVEETRGGFHRSDLLVDTLRSWGHLD